MSGRPRHNSGESWPIASVAGIAVTALSVAVFAVVPEWLLGGFLADTPLLRDLLLVVWTVVGFVALAWLVVRLQHRSSI